MRKLPWLVALMTVTILGITGFQVYWLKENYSREKNTLKIRSEFNFRETILHLQVARLNLDMPADSSGSGNLRIFMKKDGQPVKVKIRPQDEIVSTINVIREKMKDSLKRPVPPGVIISMDKTSVSMQNDSVRVDRQVVGGGREHIFQMLYGVDSLQDSIRIHEIDSAYRIALKNENLDVPFSITRDTTGIEEVPAMNKVTVGIANPVTYILSLGNSFPYLLRRILMPILFSFVLLGITILSFILLYRNLVRQKRLADLKNEFISNITHELKTPIATVGVAIEALKNFNALQDPARTKEYLDISSNELQRLELLVDKVLKLSMFEQKGIGLKPEQVNLGDIADEVMSSLKLQFEKTGTVVKRTETGNLEMEGDRLHLLSVIYNLFDNSLKYSKGSPEIELNLAGNEHELSLVIKDHGIGIPDEYKGKVFEKFFRVPHGDTHDAKGYGLGLSYVSQVIKKHSGTIAISDHAGGGTVIRISLPKQQS